MHSSPVGGAVPASDLVLRAIHDISRLMQATGGRSVLILGAQGRGGDGMEIDEHAKAQAVVSPWLASTLSSILRRQS